MLRFLPDGWLEALLRPFIMMDPSAGVYFEVSAPDLRFAAFIVFVAIALTTGKLWRRIGIEQARLMVGLMVLLYVWTFVTGNGRYFIIGMLLIGPLVVLACRLLPGTVAFRNTLLLVVIALQSLAIAPVFMPNAWGVVPWRDGPGLPIEASPLRERPAVFLTISVQTYSSLVPSFHPQSRWANITGQRDITAGSKEHPRLVSLLSSDLPKYLVFPSNPEWTKADTQPNEAVHAMFTIALADQGFALTGEDCSMLRSHLAPRVPNQARTAIPAQGFWFCPVQQSADAARRRAASQAAVHAFDDVFDRVQRSCPRFFPANDASEKVYDGLVTRNYTSTDVRLSIDAAGRVLYKYFRAINPTLVGTVEQVRKGDFQIDCEKLPGRYRLPWMRDGNP